MDRLSRFRRFLVRHRRLLAALACCAAAGSAVESLVPGTAERSVLVQAARDLPAGTLLDAGDLETVRVPADAVPPGARNHPDSLIGQRLATPLLRGSPVTQLSLAGPGLLTGAPAGSVAVPLRPADPSVLGLLRPGQLVNVVAGADTAWNTGISPEDGNGAVVLAFSVPVLWVSGAEPAGGWPRNGGGEGLVVVAADRENAARLTAASGTGGIHLVLTG
ncbi:RcpC/CpaB family pilus assembly protein [Arthrobacter sp. zg-Y877]|uniref:Flp pilus assembly protein CpaB n=1 Tax=Arthrobacter sp. zg-Y877 TaxID=3049074 RepID=UPI0025A4AF4F|nr:RcpC/CpaB family pilus assembly protein [Arthrobacter sp. zg-Y877]MDM7989949.1 RcpC/CpaB family pilus assembly protein [Arthrobacter sp. zg-Y877]